MIVFITPPNQLPYSLHLLLGNHGIHAYCQFHRGPIVWDSSLWGIHVVPNPPTNKTIIVTKYCNVAVAVTIDSLKIKIK